MVLRSLYSADSDNMAQNQLHSEEPRSSGHMEMEMVMEMKWNGNRKQKPETENRNGNATS